MNLRKSVLFVNDLHRPFRIRYTRLSGFLAPSFLGLLSFCLFTNCIAAKNGQYSALFSVFYEVSACTQYIGCMRTVSKLFIMTAVWLWKNCILREKSDVRSIPVRDNYRDTRV